MPRLNIVRIILLGITFITISGCLSTPYSVGYTFGTKDVEKIRPGKTDAVVVRALLGSPSLESSYGEPTWYYVSRDYERIAFLEPKVVSQRVVAVMFDQNNVVKQVETFDEDSIRELSVASDETKTGGRDITIIQQLLGNVGRFSGQRDPLASRGPGI